MPIVALKVDCPIQVDLPKKLTTKDLASPLHIRGRVKYLPSNVVEWLKTNRSDVGVSIVAYTKDEAEVFKKGDAATKRRRPLRRPRLPEKSEAVKKADAAKRAAEAAAAAKAEADEAAAAEAKEKAAQAEARKAAAKKKGSGIKQGSEGQA